VENTIRIDASPDQNETLANLLDVVSAIDIFRSLSLIHAMKLLHAAKHVRIEAGELICQAGVRMPHFMIILAGSAQEDEKSTKQPALTVGAYLGLRSVIGQVPELKTIRAITPINAITMHRQDLLYFVEGDAMGTMALERMRRIIALSDQQAYQAVQNNSWLMKLSHVQQAEFVSIMGEEITVPPNTILWEQGDICDRAIIISHGHCVIDEQRRKLGRGTLFAELASLHLQHPYTTSCSSIANLSYFEIPRQEILTFIEHNPVILLAVYKSSVLV
jgi:CRP-like cAMP-binding protein